MFGTEFKFKLEDIPKTRKEIERFLISRCHIGIYYGKALNEYPHDYANGRFYSTYDMVIVEIPDTLDLHDAEKITIFTGVCAALGIHQLHFTNGIHEWNVFSSVQSRIGGE